jgi:hypothetical protein
MIRSVETEIRKKTIIVIVSASLFAVEAWVKHHRVNEYQAVEMTT